MTLPYPSQKSALATVNELEVGQWRVEAVDFHTSGILAHGLLSNWVIYPDFSKLYIFKDRFTSIFTDFL